MDEIEAPAGELEERGGLQKLREREKRLERAQEERASYKCWFQKPCWFDEDARGGGTRPAAPQGAGYQGIREWLEGPGKSQTIILYADDSDFDRLKHRAEHRYFVGDYEGAAELYLRIMGTFRLVQKGGGGVFLEVQDGIARCLLQLGKVAQAEEVVADMRPACKTRKLLFALLNARMLKQAGRSDESRLALQEAAAVHPGDPMGWVQLAEAYRTSPGDTGRLKLLARASLRFAVKMVSFGSNAVQCTVSMRYFSRALECVLDLCKEHAPFFLGGGEVLEDEDPKAAVMAHFMGLQMSEEDAALMADGASPFELQWLCLDGAEAATKMLAKVKEDIIGEATG